MGEQSSLLAVVVLSASSVLSSSVPRAYVRVTLSPMERLPLGSLNASAGNRFYNVNRSRQGESGGFLAIRSQEYSPLVLSAF